jgi:lipid A 3-O-deacylase
MGRFTALQFFKINSILKLLPNELSGIVNASTKTKMSIAGKFREFSKMKILFVIFIAAIFFPSAAYSQQRPVDGGHEIEFWTGGGHGINGSTASDSVFNAGARYGWILTKSHGPGFLRGKFEFAADVVPVFLVFQPANTAYGFGFNPVNLKWDFDRDSRVAPFVELGGGLLFTNHQVPSGTSQINFTPTGAVGFHVFSDSVTWTAELRYLHVSNAGLVSPNPGINTIEVCVGLGWFTSGHQKHRRSNP